MQYRRSLIDILKGVFNAMTFNGNVTKVTSIANPTGFKGNTYLLNVTDIFHAAIGYSMTWTPGGTYTIIGWDDTQNSMTITVNDSSGAEPAPPKGPFTLYNPFFFHGTPIETDSEIKDLEPATKFPMVWIMEQFEEVFTDLDPQSSHERTTDNIRIFFLDQSKREGNLTDDLMTQYVKPMQKLRDIFLESMKSQYSIFEIWDLKFTTKPYTKFGVIVKGGGAQKNLFADELAGCELQITLKILNPPNNWKGQ